jgi:hypothetical protein
VARGSVYPGDYDSSTALRSSRHDRVDAHTRHQRAPSCAGFAMRRLPFCTLGFLFPRPISGTSCALCLMSATSSPRVLFSACDPRGLSWRDLAEGRLRLDRLSRNGGRIDFLPLGLPPRATSRAGTRFAHSSRAKKVSPLPSSAALRPGGCVVDRLRPADRHRGRGGRGLAISKEK